ncbi:MAG: PASTA domain-containing protein [candidate division WOR-3 bacterium]
MKTTFKGILKFGVYFAVWVVIWLLFFDFFLSLIIPIFQGRYNTTVVPNLNFKTVEEAKAEAKKFGLNLVVDTIIPTIEHPKGVIIGQEPPPNTKVKRGRRVFVTVSGGAHFKKVPDIVGMSLDLAVRSLQDQGFTVRVEPIYTIDEEPGYVIRINPSPGTDVPIGSTITLYYTEEPPDTSQTDTAPDLQQR